MRWWVALVVVVGCAPELRPPAPANRDVVVPPLASSMLQFPSPTPSTASAPDRFETRRIGEAPAEGPVRVRGSGRLIDLDVKDADIQDVLRLIADVGKVTLVVDASVAGRVTMRLRQVPWQQALAAVTSTKGLAVTNDGELLIVRGAR